MIVLLSSARTIVPDHSLKAEKDLFQEETEELLEILRKKEKIELQKIWGCSLKSLDAYHDELQEMDLTKTSPAIISYDGVVFKQFKDLLRERRHDDYLKRHVRIISAFYGCLRPFDGIVPYRLEMASPLKINGKNLYDFWSYKIYEECRSDVIVDLASEEYGKCVRNYCDDSDFFLDIDFLEMKEGEYRRISTNMKKARGTMLRYMLERNIEDHRLLKDFDRLGYHYKDELSDERKYTFVKEEKK